MQSSVTDYFKRKKRPRESMQSSKKSKLVALSEAETGDVPTPVRLTKNSSSPEMEPGLPKLQRFDAEDKSRSKDGVKSKKKDKAGSSKAIPGVNSEDVKKLLQNKKSLADLKNAIAGINDCEKKLEKFRKVGQSEYHRKAAKPAVVSADTKLNVPLPPSPTKNKKCAITPEQFYSPRNENIFTSPFKLVDIPSPIRIPSKTVKRLFETESSTSADVEPKITKLPAYQKFHHLAQGPTSSAGSVSPSSTKSDDSLDGSGLILPFKFKLLLDLFNAVETVVTIFYNRKEVITFKKVKIAVQELVRRVSLREKHLGQMLTVFPGCYVLSQEKLKTPGTSGSAFHLTLSLNLPTDQNMSSTLLNERGRTFNENLLSICKQHHKKYLKSKGVVLPEGKVVRRWHPSFRLDDIPDIIGADVPAPPAQEPVNTARDVINRAQHILEHANPKMKKALQGLIQGSISAAEAPPQSESVKTKNKLNKDHKKSVTALRGISQSLIEKIRAREQQKVINSVTCTPEQEKDKAMLSRLPSLVKILRNLMVLEKRFVLPFATVVEKLCHSNHGSLSRVEMETHVQKMLEVLPNWIKMYTLSQGQYIKIYPNVDINETLNKLEEKNA